MSPAQGTQDLGQGRLALQQRPLVPLQKALMARLSGDEGWARMLPPMAPLGPESEDVIAACLDLISG